MKNDLTLFSQLHDLCINRLEKVFLPYLSAIPSLELKTAMGHALLNRGKHLRPALIYASGSIFDAPLENLDIAACSIEILHTYSLIHDDLPCMDDADLRRGQPTCHKLYGEGMAVLTGDALHTLAMQILSDHPAPIKAEKRLQMIRVVSKACGPFGMAAGQSMDLSIMQDKSISSDLLLDIYRLKTGALFSACIELGWLSSHDDDETNRKTLLAFSDDVGMAFQIQDDIIDVQAQSELSGKPQGLDAKNNKVTYVQLHGLNAAKEKVEHLYQNALERINHFGKKAKLLRGLIQQMLERPY